MGSVIAKATTDNSPERKGGDESSSKREGAGLGGLLGGYGSDSDSESS